MGLEDLTEAQQQLLHPLIKLKQKSSMDSLGGLLQIVNDLTRLYQGFSEGLRQLEAKAEKPPFLSGTSNQGASDALRAIRGDINNIDDVVIAITKEQKGMAAVWNSLLTLISRTQKETNDFINILNSSVNDPLGTFYEEFKEGFTESVDQLQMNDVLNFIPNLKLLKETQGFSHCGAKKHVESVLKSYKELQQYLENEKGMVKEAGSTKGAKLQAKAVNKTVKAKISLGKHIQQLFEAAPEMKVLITKNVSKETLERLATMKLKKSTQPAEEIHMDIVGFQEKFCRLEKRRLSIFSSCLQFFAENMVKYKRNVYNNLREMYQSIVDFSPEADYVQFEAQMLGARVSHASKHSRMPDEVWIPREFETLESLQMKKQSNVCIIMHQPAEMEQFDDETDTIVGDSVSSRQDSISTQEPQENQESHTSFLSDMQASDNPVVELDSSNTSEESTTPILDMDIEGEKNSMEFSKPTDEETQMPVAILKPASSMDMVQETIYSDETNMKDDSKAADDAHTEEQAPEEEKMETTEIKESKRQDSVMLMSSLTLGDSMTQKKHSGFALKSVSLLRGRKKSERRSRSMEKILEKQEQNKGVWAAQNVSGNQGPFENASIKRSNSELPGALLDLSIQLVNDEKKDKNSKKEAKREAKEEKKEAKKEAKREAKEEKKEAKREYKKESQKKRGKGDKIPFAVMSENGIQCDSSHFAVKKVEIPREGINLDYSAFNSASEVLRETKRRSDEYFLKLNTKWTGFNREHFDFLNDKLINMMDEVENYLQYPFDTKAGKAADTSTLNVGDLSDLQSSETTTEVTAPAMSSEDYNLQRLMKLQFSFEDNLMDYRQWKLFALEQLVFLHKYLSGFLNHSCLSNNSDPTFRDFLLSNLGIVEHMVIRVRSFIEMFKSYTMLTKPEFQVLDAFLTPRDTLVSTNPHLNIHQMDMRYRLILMVDSWNKNDIDISGKPLFEVREFYECLYRQIFLVKLSLAQKLARVIRRVPVIDCDLDKKWIEALNSEVPKEVLNIQFKFEDSPKVDRLANKILFLLCECIGRLNNLKGVIEKRHWGEESAVDSNYMSARDQLVQIINMTAEVEDLDNELLETLDLNEKQGGYTHKTIEEKASASIQAANPFKLKTEDLHYIRRSMSPSKVVPMKDSFQQNPEIKDIPIIKRSEADHHFCTPMEIFNDEEISLLRRVNTRKGCFGKCTSWRTRRNVKEDSNLNPYFMLAVDSRQLSRCWKLEGSVILKLAAIYHEAFSVNLPLVDWPVNFTTVEYVIYFISTGCLLNFLLYKKKHNEGYDNLCTLYHALLSANFLHRRKDVLEESFFGGITNKNENGQLKQVDETGEEDLTTKDTFAMLQVPLNLSGLPKLVEDIDVYLQHDFSALPYTSNVKTVMQQDVPDCSSLQLANFVEAMTKVEALSLSKAHMYTMQLERPSFKVNRLLIDSIKQNVPMLVLLSGSDSISLINATPMENMVVSILMLREMTTNFRMAIFRKLLNFTMLDGSDSIIYNLSSFMLINRLLYPYELRQTIEKGAKSLDTQSTLEASEGTLNMDSVLRHIIINNAKKLMSTVITKVEAFGIEDLDELAAFVIETVVVSIKENMQMTRVWEEFLPMGDFPTLFTNACIYFMKKYIRYRIARPLGICKVMPAVHKLLLLQREIETSRLLRIDADVKSGALMKVFKFSFGKNEEANNCLLEEHSDFMEIISLTELETKLASFREIINRAIKNEDWTCIASKTYTNAVVDLATVLNATLKAVLDLKVPLYKLLVPLTGSLETCLNHYYSSLVGPKVTDEVANIMGTLKNTSGSLSGDAFKKLGNVPNLERGIIQMSNVIYLANYLNETQEGLMTYCHHMLSERCEGSVELHQDIGTNIHCDSDKFFSFDAEDLKVMKEVALIPASKRIITRQCSWHVKSLSWLYSLKELQKMAMELYRPTATHGPGVKAFLGTIKNMCTEFGKLGEARTHALEGLFDVVFSCVMYAIRSTRRLPQETGMLNDDLRVLQWLASEHQQDVSQLIQSASKLIL